jgi:hypothetical protein
MSGISYCQRGSERKYTSDVDVQLFAELLITDWINDIWIILTCMLTSAGKCNYWNIHQTTAHIALGPKPIVSRGPQDHTSKFLTPRFLTVLRVKRLVKVIRPGYGFLGRSPSRCTTVASIIVFCFRREGLDDCDRCLAFLGGGRRAWRCFCYCGLFLAASHGGRVDARFRDQGTDIGM